MKWLVITLAVLVGLALIVVAVGWLLPVAHTARGQRRLAAPPDTVWRAITDVEAFTSWRPDVTRVERLPDRDGRAVWTEHGSSGSMTIAVERSEPPRTLVTRIQPGLPFGGTWTYEITPDAGGSLLTITEDGEVYNPIFRFMSRFVFGHEATITGYLTAIQARSGELVN
jgi:carbon monoxide dehydrogenase subunit G